MTALLEIKLLGPPHALLDGEPLSGFRSNKTQALLYYLGATRQPQPRAALAALFWGDVAEQHARRSLTSALSNLRGLVPDHVVANRETIALDLESRYRLDVAQFETALDDRHPDTASLHHAIERYQGDFLDGFYIRDAPEFEQWVEGERTRLHERLLDGLSVLAQGQADAGDLEGAIASGRRLLGLAPWREETHRRLMRHLAQSGQRSAALAQFERCKELLDQELGVEPEAETIALAERIRLGQVERSAAPVDAQPDSLIVQPTPGSLTPSLPVYPTHFVGREVDLAYIMRRIHDPACRLLTLVGPGGIGKTRLASETARRLASDADESETYADGIYFVELQPVAAMSGIAAAIGEAIGFSFSGSADTEAQLAAYLHDKRVLLVLDNFEHLLDGARMIADLLSVAPSVNVLATSREALRIQEEWFHPVAGLSFPDLNRESSPKLESFDAVRLFELCASRAQSAFSLTEERDHVVRICQLVDGMPLGIELAATWLSVFPTSAIADEIEHNMDLLTARHRDVPERHRSMRAVLEQSWELLSTREQQNLSRLSVFQGDFDQAAAQAVGELSMLEMAPLVEKALVRTLPDGRFLLHELLRQFVVEKLDEDRDAADEGRRRHCGYYLDFVRQRDETLCGPAQRTTLDEIVLELDNIQAAWTFAAERQEWDLIVIATHGLYQFYSLRSRYQEGAESFSFALDHLEKGMHQPLHDQTKRVRSQLQIRYGALLLVIDAIEVGREMLEAGVRDAEYPADQAFAYVNLARLARAQGRRTEAISQLEHARVLSQAAGDFKDEASALLGLCAVSNTFGDFDRGLPLGLDALKLARQAGQPDLIAQALLEVAWSRNCLGMYVDAEDNWAEALAISRAIGSRYGIAISMNFLGWAAFCKGENAATTARGLYEKAAAIYRQIGDQHNLTMCLGDMALCEIDMGEFEEAKQVAEEGIKIAEAVGNYDLHSYLHVSLGFAIAKLGNVEAGYRHLLTALTLSVENDIRVQTMLAIYYFAQLLILLPPAGDVPLEEEQAHDLALTLLAYLDQQPATWHLYRVRARALIGQVHDRVLVDTAERALDRGREARLEKIVDAVRDVL